MSETTIDTEALVLVDRLITPKKGGMIWGETVVENEKYVHDPKDCGYCLSYGGKMWLTDQIPECPHTVPVGPDGKCHSCECQIIWAAGINRTLERIARDVEKRP